MYSFIVILLHAFVVRALTNDLDDPVGNASNALHDSSEMLAQKFVNKVINRVLKASSHCYADVDGVTLGKHGQGHCLALVHPNVPSVPHMAHHGPAAERAPRLPFHLRASVTTGEHSMATALTGRRDALVSGQENAMEVGPQAHRASRFTADAGQLQRRVVVAGLVGGVLGTSVCPCWAASEPFEKGTAPIMSLADASIISQRLEDTLEQIGNVKTLVEAGEFSRAQELIKIVEFANLRNDVSKAGSLLRSMRPDFEIFRNPAFELAVVDPLDLTEFALNRAEARMHTMQKVGLPPEYTRPDDVLFNLNRLQDGIGVVVEALKCQCSRDEVSGAGLH